MLDEKHLQHIVKQFVAHYHAERPHQALKWSTPLERRAANLRLQELLAA